MKNRLEYILSRFKKWKGFSARNSMTADVGESSIGRGLVENSASFSSKMVEDVMVPRLDIVAVREDAELNALIEIVVTHHHTRIIVYRRDLDDVVGFLHIKDLFAVLNGSKQYNLKTLVRRSLIVPRSLGLPDALCEMQQKRIHIAVVVDEYGGTDGILTIEDVIESIVGRIDDEHDDIEGDGFEILSDRSIISSGRVTISSLEKVLKRRLKRSAGDFDTIAGLVSAKSPCIPSKGQVIEIGEGISVEILESTPRAIKQVKIIFDEKSLPKGPRSK